ncbi:MAG: hypothetical protein K9N06_01215 [Candidatus Cloacimonetes bacterium]|nr:hypothetical protein [Candidatus Cloacimonadota bacterium]
MKSYVLPGLIIIAIAISGCSYNEALYANLTRNKNSLEFVHDSEIVVGKKNVTVNIDTIYFSSTAMRERAYVEEEKSDPLSTFLLIKEYKCGIGRNDIQDNIPDFIYQSFVEETHRSGIFLLNAPLSGTEDFAQTYDLEITVDKLKVDGEFVFSGSEKNQEAHPALATCQMTLVLKKDNEIVYTKKITEWERTKYITNQEVIFGSVFLLPDIRGQYASDMAEALSNVINKTIRGVVHEVNAYLEQNEQELITIQEISVEEIEHIQLATKIKKLPSSYLNFNIAGGKTVSGMLLSADKRFYYVEDERVLYTIKKKSVTSITDNDLQELKEEDLASIKFQRINYNKYSKLEDIE